MNNKRYDVKVTMARKLTMCDLKELQKALKGQLNGQVFSPDLDMSNWQSVPLEMVVDERVWVFQLDDSNDFDAFAKALRTIPDVRDVEKFRGLSGEWPQTSA